MVSSHDIGLGEVRFESRGKAWGGGDGCGPPNVPLILTLFVDENLPDGIFLIPHASSLTDRRLTASPPRATSSIDRSQRNLEGCTNQACSDCCWCTVGRETLIHVSSSRNPFGDFAHGFYPYNIFRLLPWTKYFHTICCRTDHELARLCLPDQHRANILRPSTCRHMSFWITMGQTY